MRYRIIILSLFSLLLLPSNSCENSFPKNKEDLSSQQYWWNGLNDTWKELCLREAGYLGERINDQILEEILALEKFELDYYPLGEEGLEPLEPLIHLKEISAGNTQITHLNNLGLFHELRYLNIPDTPIDDLTPLKELKHLEELYVQQSLITDLSPLSNMHHLQILVIHETKVQSLKPIMHLGELSFLSIVETKIPNNEIQEFIQKHPHCEINQ